MSESTWRPDYNKTPQRIVCAANRNRKSGRIICGARHWDKIMRSQKKRIDQFGDFLTRAEAFVIALHQGQIRRVTGGDRGCLFSENLY
jgi:hypothetical protein